MIAVKLVLVHPNAGQTSHSLCKWGVENGGLLESTKVNGLIFKGDPVVVQHASKQQAVEFTVHILGSTAV